MLVKVKIQTEPKGKVIRIVPFLYETDTTVEELMEAFETLGYIYPKYKLYLHGKELARHSKRRLSTLLKPEDDLHLVDPLLLAGLAIGALAGGAIGYTVGKNQNR